eukprot:scaffold89523_cov29-Prasinocladus_malaysianus.AAC.3
MKYMCESYSDPPPCTNSVSLGLKRMGSQPQVSSMSSLGSQLAKGAKRRSSLHSAAMQADMAVPIVEWKSCELS